MTGDPLPSPTEASRLEFSAFVGRQAIFDEKMEIFAYELLFRSGLENVFTGVDGDQATSSVISNSFFDMGLNHITGGKRASINFTRNTLIGNYAQLLPKDKLVVEILEDVEADAEVVQAVKSLKKLGYLIALDDFQEKDLESPLLDHADVIKVDFLDTPPERRAAYIEQLKNRNLLFLAEKVESREEFLAAIDMGYSLFQGYFFCKPVLISGKRIPESKVNQIRLLKEVNQQRLEFDKIEEIFRHDVAMSYKLFRYINSVSFGLRQEVSNLRQTFILLGPKRLRKWISLTALSALGFDKPPELLVTAVIRARFCELMAELFDMRDREDELFLVGMFSTIDALLDMSMERVVEEIKLSDSLKSVLLGEPCDLSRILNVAIGYEAGDWDLFGESLKGLDVDENAIPPLYLEAVKMAEEFLKV
jgi:EAL and modified HD-GYP domain-containing signal transduction protein